MKFKLFNTCLHSYYFMCTCLIIFLSTDLIVLSFSGPDPQAMAGRSRSQCQLMAEHLLRESSALDKQLNSLISRRVGGDDTMHTIYQLR